MKVFLWIVLYQCIILSYAKATRLKNSCEVFSGTHIPHGESITIGTNLVQCVNGALHAVCELPDGRVLENGERSKVSANDCIEYECHDGNLRLASVAKRMLTCPASYTKVEGLGCVKHVARKTNWCDARRACSVDGADLLTSTDPNYVMPLKSIFPHNNKPAWIGLRKVFSPYWSWIGKDRITTTSSAWAKVEPNGDGECGELNHGALNDVPCSTEFFFICQIFLS